MLPDENQMSPRQRRRWETERERYRKEREEWEASPEGQAKKEKQDIYRKNRRFLRVLHDFASGFTADSWGIKPSRQMLKILDKLTLSNEDREALTFNVLYKLSNRGEEVFQRRMGDLLQFVSHAAGKPGSRKPLRFAREEGTPQRTDQTRP